MLNMTRPAMLRQYYGVDKLLANTHTVERVTYEYTNGTNPVGTAPLEVYIKIILP